MDYLAITNRYYARWLGVADDLMYLNGIHAVKSSQRDVCQKGYPVNYDLYVFLQNERIIVSYNDKTALHLVSLLTNIKSGDIPAHVTKTVKDLYKVTPAHHIACVFHHPEPSPVTTKKLGPTDFPHFVEFFKASHPKTEDTGWLLGYYRKIIAKGCAYGIIIDGRLVAATDAPDMPYMEGEVQEAGILTLSEYRKQGYAKSVCSAAVASLLRRNICPMASLNAENIASERLAYSVGFRKLADMITVSLKST